jgi:MFS family permease
VPSRNLSLGLPALNGLVSRILVAFRVPGFPWLWASATLGAMSMMAGGLTVGWLVLDLTDSPFWVGAVAAARGFGQVGFGVFAGVLIDRLDKRHVLAVSQIFNGAAPLILSLLVMTDQIALWHILLANLLQGIFMSIRAPTINTVAYQMAGPQRMLNASAAINLSFNLASATASAIAGALIAVRGVESGLLFSAACAFVGGILVLFIRGVFKTTAAREPFLRAAVGGVKYAWANLPVRRLVSLSVIMEMFGFSYYVMLPVVARDVLGVDAAGLGLLSSMGGVGSTLSTLGIASLGDFKNKSSLLVSTVISTGLFLVFFGFSRWYVSSLVIAIFLGASLSGYDATIRTLFLLVPSDQVRGRVQSIYTLTYGFMSFGGFLVGSVATVASAPLAITASGGIILGFILRYLRLFVQLRPMGDNVAPIAK